MTVNEVENIVITKNRKAHENKSKFKAVLLIFFDFKCVIRVDSKRHKNLLVFLLKVLIQLKERVRKNGPDYKNKWYYSSRQCACSHSIFREAVFG